MANHDFAPSTNFTYEDPGVFRLRAMRDLQAGEEVGFKFTAFVVGTVLKLGDDQIAIMPKRYTTVYHRYTRCISRVYVHSGDICANSPGA